MKLATSKAGHKARLWTNEDVSWEEFCNRCRRYMTADVTRAEFDKLSKDRQTEIKAMNGAFVGGELKNGVRKRGSVLCRSMITLDLDHVEGDAVSAVESWQDLSQAKALTYTTFKSTQDSLRLRVVIPLKEPVTEDRYEPVARAVANSMDVIDYCDPASFSATQLMFLPVYAKDVEACITEYKGEFLDAEEVIKGYADIEDVDSWPKGKQEEPLRKQRGASEDPYLKAYPIGAFCRVYSIDDAIDTWLQKNYEKAGGNRYHFKGANSTAGALVYDDGKFLYSNHSSDPAFGLNCNAFDLVRIHMFGKEDATARAGTPFNKLPSFKKMYELALHDTRVIRLKLAEDFKEAPITDKEEIKKAIENTSLDWAEELERDKAGNVKGTLSNLSLIIEKDERLQAIKYDLFSDCFSVTGPLPWAHEGKGWKEEDLANLCVYMSKAYGINASANVFTALTATVRNFRAYHPVRDYLLSLSWDGKKRIEDLLIHYLGADDNELNKAITRKTLVAAVARIMQPGIKYDTMTVLVGGQGIGKSRILRLLGGEWFSDSLTLTDMKDKSGVEKLSGAWISEVAELSGMRKTDSETIKGFITRQDDKMRPAYGHTVVSKPRQGIFVGTTNEEDGFLRDQTGNRRYNIVRVHGKPDLTPEKWDLNEDLVGQLWAEAVCYYKQGESLILSKDLQDQLSRLQDVLLEDDDRIGDLQKYLDTQLPVEWPSMTTIERRDFLNGREFKPHKGTVRRVEVCIAEIWAECFECEKAKLERRNSFEIRAMLIKLGWRRTGKSVNTGLYGVQKTYGRLRKL